MCVFNMCVSVSAFFFVSIKLSLIWGLVCERRKAQL